MTLKELMKKRYPRFSIKDMAEDMNVGENMLWRWSVGESEPPIRYLDILKTYFQVELKDIVQICMETTEAYKLRQLKSGDIVDQLTAKAVESEVENGQ